MTPLRLATRASPLALWQAHHAANLLRRAHPGLPVVLVPVVSTGDVDRSTPLYGMGNVGVFAKEVHQAVRDGRADVGVHSCKDLPTTWPDGIALAATLRRADPRDALIGAATLAELPPGAKVGTSSLRRQHQILAVRPDLRCEPIRGNVETRLRKVADGEFDATLMAMAGLRRLGLRAQARAAPLDPTSVCTPAPAQGAVALDCRLDDRRTRALMARLDHRPTTQAVTVEREVLAGLRGGCSLPFGCLVRYRRDLGWHAHVALAVDGSVHRWLVCGPRRGLAQRILAAIGG